mgnify:FL=1
MGRIRGDSLKMSTAVVPAFALQDMEGNDYSFPSSEASLLVFVKEDCPTCNLIMPIIDEVHTNSHFSVLAPGQTIEGNHTLIKNHNLSVPILDDSSLKVSFAYDVETVPLVILADNEGKEIDRLIGFDRNEWVQFFGKHIADVNINWDSFPEWRPGCGSLTQDPIIADKLRAESENSPLRARKIEIAPADDVHEFMFDQGFTDGLPVVPPTPERVLRMLEGTARKPQDTVAIMPPNMAEATVEKIAVNAVLAGCKPEYMPVVIATIEAICTDEFNCHGVFATTMGASPVMIINGPIREQLGFNMKLGALGQGTRANAAIGRAVRLAVRNIGGARPSGTERSTLGSPMKFTMCFAEWEERNPWDPLHVERGFDRNDSVVSVFAMSSGPALIVDQTSRTAPQLAGSFGLSMEASHHVKSHNAGDTILVVCPEHVDTLTRDNYSKDDIRNRIQEVTGARAADLVADDISGVGIPQERVSEMTEAQLDKIVPKFASKDNIHIVVAGSDAGKFSAAFHGWASGSMGSIPVSRKIET